MIPTGASLLILLGGDCRFSSSVCLLAVLCLVGTQLVGTGHASDTMGWIQVDQTGWAWC